MKNQKSNRQTEEFLEIYRAILRIFAEVQDASSLSKSSVMELVQIQRQNAFFFDQALEQTFLKIFKCFHEKANKKIPVKFQTVSDLLFKEILKNNSNESITSLNNFCSILSDGIFSTIMNIRVMAARIMFLILKGLPSVHSMNTMFTQKVQNSIAQSVLFLVKQKVSTYRQLGIKLSSLALLLKSDSKQAIQNELFRILSTEENQMIRKMVMTNIPINQGNIEKILIRLRDKQSQIRAILLRRLVTQNYRLQRLKLNSLYKILYDGYGTKDIVCKQQALRYFASYFKQSQMNNQNKFETFVQLFQPNLLLVNSHLYVLFNKLIGQLIGFLPSAPMCDYILKLCNRVKACLKDRNSNVSNELIWLKNSSNFKPETKQVNNVFQQYSPSATQFAELLLVFLQRKNVFAVHQFLQIFTNIQMPDQIGRNKMFNNLKEALSKLNYFQLKFDLFQINKNDDICNVQTMEEIKLKKLMLSYYDIQIISNSVDLIFPIISAMKALRPDSFSLEIQQTISDWQNPDEYPVYNEKGTTQLTINQLLTNPQKLGAKNPKAQIQMFRQKLVKIDQQIDFLKNKTVVAVASVSKIQYDFSMDAYMPLIKDELTKQDQSYGIYLLGLYCLGNVQNVKMFFPLYWNHIMNQQPKSNPQSNQYQQYRLNLMVSLKLMTDFIVKFNILNSDNVMNNSSTDQTTNYNSDTFMEQMTHLILHKDTAIRIFSIECLCRMIYHNRVDENNISTYFLYLLLLWWQTSTQEVSAKSVHTISLFFRSYLEKGNQQVKKLAEMLCIFHKILKIFEEKNKTINKRLIVYNLKINQFIKKTVSIATTVLKYHKEKKTIWTYEEAQLGPQQFFLLYLLYEPGFQNILEKPINVSDFYVKCPLQTLIFVKKKIQRFEQLVEDGQFYPSTYRFDKVVTKKSLEEINRFEKQIESHISVKNEETFNEEIIKTLQKIFSESCKYINEEARRIAKNIEEEEIFVNIDSDMEEQSDQVSDSQEESDSVAENKSISEQLSEQNPTKMKMEENQNSSYKANKPLKRQIIKKKNKVIQEIQSGSEQASQGISQEESVQQIKPKKGSRKKAPSQRNLNPRQQVKHQSVQKGTQQSLQRRTRARKPIY